MIFEVKTVGDPREWQNNYGRFFAYPVDLLEEETGKMHLGVEWSRKVDSQAPQVGDRVVGHIQGGQHGDKLKVDFEATKELTGGGAGRSAASSGGTRQRTWEPEAERDPEKVARIGRAHSQEMAVRILVGVPGFAAAAKEDKRDALRDWADWFELDVARAAKAGGSGAPAPAPAPGPSQPDAVERSLSGDEDIPF